MYRFDYTEWPIVVVRHDGSNTDEEFDSYLRELDRLIGGSEQYVIVDVLPRGSDVPSPERLKQFARWYEKNRVRAIRMCLGAASVIPDAAVRGAANFFVQLVRAGSPRYTAESEDDAMRWARQQMAEHARRLAPA